MVNMHQARVLLFQVLFTYSMSKYHDDDESIKKELLNIDWLNRNIHKDETSLLSHFITLFLDKQDEIDYHIECYSTKWSMKRISKINLAILRVSILQFMDTKFKIPPKVIIDEAIILSQQFSDSSSGRYLNGILDKFYKEIILKEDTSLLTTQ